MFGLIPNVGPWELAAILAIVLIVFGPGKLPQAAKSLGNSIREFRKASSSREDGEAKMEGENIVGETK